MLVSIGAGRALFGYCKEYLFDLVSVQITCDIRRTVFRHIQKLPLRFFDNTNTGELLARLKDDVDKFLSVTGFVGMLIIESMIDPYINEEERPTGLMPYYNTTEKMKNHYLNSKAIQKMMAAAFTSIIRNLQETLPEKVIQNARLMDLKQAMRNVHFPENATLLREAQYRLKFEELFYIQLNMIVI